MFMGYNTTSLVNACKIYIVMFADRAAVTSLMCIFLAFLFMCGNSFPNLIPAVHENVRDVHLDFV